VLETLGKKTHSIFLVEAYGLDYERFKTLLNRILQLNTELTWAQNKAGAQLHSTKLTVNAQPNGEMCFSLFFPATTANAIPNQRQIL